MATTSKKPATKKKAATKKKVTNLCRQLLGDDNPADFNQALMDFGSLQCVPKNPDCEKCPLRDECYAFKEQKVDFLPVSIKNCKSKRDSFTFYSFLTTTASTSNNERKTKSMKVALTKVASLIPEAVCMVLGMTTMAMAEDTLVIMPNPLTSPAAVIYYTNDVHTYLDKDNNYAKLATLLANTPDAMLVDAGDQIQGFGEDCCLAQGPEGVAMAPLSAVMKTADGLVLNAYEALEADYAIGGEKATLKVEGGFPFADGAVSVSGFAAGEWTLKLRIPYYWNSACSLKLNGGDVKGAKAGGYLDLRRDWKPGDRLEISFDLSPREQISPDRSSRALLSGPLVLASDSRFTRTRTVDVVPGTGWVREPDALGEMRSVWRDSRGTRLTDYASAGNRFRHDNRLRVWFDRDAALPGADNPDARLVVSAGSAAIKVGTSNVKCPAPWDKTLENQWGYRSPFLFEQWRAQNPDVIGMQEPVAEYVDAIAAAFPEWDHVGIGREGGAKGEFGPIFWRKDRFELLKDGTFWLSGKPDEVGSVYPGANHPRICTFAYLKDRRTGKTVAFYNTHTSYVSEKICSAQIAMIAAHMKANAPKGAVRILTGDLNFEAGGAALKPAFDAGLVNADDVCTGPLSGLWNSVTLYRFFPKSAPAEAVRQFLAQHGGDLKAARKAFGDLGSRIDHILVSPDVKVTACGVDDANRGGWYPSDHMPKFAVIEL